MLAALLTLAALASVATATPAHPGGHARSLPVTADVAALAPDSDPDPMSVTDIDAAVTPVGGDPIVGDTEPDSWLAGLPVYDSWLAEDDVADLIGAGFAPDELDALMQRSAGPLGRIDVSIAYRRRDDLLRTATETSRHVDELWLVATWSR